MIAAKHLPAALVTFAMLSFAVNPVFADSGHGSEKKPAETAKDMMKNLREEHGAHEHGHDFEAMEKMSPKQLGRVIALMQDVGIVLPTMDPARGRKLFVDTGCVVCHAVNKVGGDVGPSLNAEDLPSPMNAFEFAARMWRGAAAMTAMQEDILGGVIQLSGQDLADLVAFAHDKSEQKKMTSNDIPAKFKKLIEN